MKRDPDPLVLDEQSEIALSHLSALLGAAIGLFAAFAVFAPLLFP